MKKKLFIGDILLVFMLLLGCSSQKYTDNRLVKEELTEAQIFYVVIEMDFYKKIVTNQDDLDLITSYIKDIQISDNVFEVDESIKEDKMIRFKIFDSEKTMITSISILKKTAFYDNKWHSIDTQTYDRILSFYKNSNYKELRDPVLLDIEQRRLDRKGKTTSEALQGNWLSENGSEIKFDKNYLYQGNNNDYIFEYNIKEANKNNLDISIYGTKGIFVKGRELSKLDIKMDETKTYMIMKKNMAGGATYHDKLVYVGKDRIKLGEFDAYFFYEK